MKSVLQTKEPPVRRDAREKAAAVSKQSVRTPAPRSRKDATVNMHEAKTHLSKLVERVAMGEEIVIAKAGKPVAKLVKFAEPILPRKPGAWKGKVWISPDFDKPDPELEDLFYNSPIFPPE
jgi:prevent-host-death family protein